MTDKKDDDNMSVDRSHRCASMIYRVRQRVGCVKLLCIMISVICVITIIQSLSTTQPPSILNTSNDDHHTKDLLLQWETVHAELPSLRESQEYCVSVCDRKCCVSKRGSDFVQVIHDSLPHHTLTHSLNDVTLVSHGSLDRLEVMGVMASRWSGPMVVAIVLDDVQSNDINTLTSLLDTVKSWGLVKVLVYRNVLPQFPINSLRNVVIDHASTLYVLAVDADFVPSSDLYSELKTYVLPHMHTMHAAAMVIPHFESWPCKTDRLRSGDKSDTYTIAVPSTLSELVNHLHAGTAQAFHAPSDMLPGLAALSPPSRKCKYDKYIWTPGVKETDYGRWLQLSTKNERGYFPLEVDRSVGGPKWEPFVVVKRVEADGTKLPRAPEEFHDRHGNKVAIIDRYKIQYQYSFYTLLRGFLTHKFHVRRDGDSAGQKEHQADMDNLLYSLRKQYVVDARRDHSSEDS